MSAIKGRIVLQALGGVNQFLFLSIKTRALLQLRGMHVFTLEPQTLLVRHNLCHFCASLLPVSKSGSSLPPLLGDTARRSGLPGPYQGQRRVGPGAEQEIRLTRAARTLSSLLDWHCTGKVLVQARTV